MMLNISFGSYYYKSLVKKKKNQQLKPGNFTLHLDPDFFNQQIREGLI